MADICPYFQKGYCRNGNRCKFLHPKPTPPPDPLKDNIDQTNVTIISKLGSNGMYIQSISGIDINISTDMMLNKNGYTDILNYLNSKGYKITFVNTVVESKYIEDHMKYIKDPSYKPNSLEEMIERKHTIIITHLCKNFGQIEMN